MSGSIQRILLYLCKRWWSTYRERKKMKNSSKQKKRKKEETSQCWLERVDPIETPSIWSCLSSTFVSVRVWRELLIQRYYDRYNWDGMQITLILSNRCVSDEKKRNPTTRVRIDWLDELQLHEMNHRRVNLSKFLKKEGIKGWRVDPLSLQDPKSRPQS